MSDDENDNRAEPSPSAVAGADAVRRYIEAKAAKDERLVDLLHRALAVRYSVKPEDKES